MNAKHPVRSIGAGLLLTLGLATMGLATTADPLRAKEFIVMGYQGLAAELATQRGPYLNTLLDLLKIIPDQQMAMIEQVKGYLKTYPNIMDFADHVVEPYSTAPIPASPAAAAPVAVPMQELLPPLPKGPKIFSGDTLENALQHLGKGMKINVYPKSGAPVSGTFNDYDARRLWIRTPTARSFRLDEIRAVDAPDL